MQKARHPRGFTLIELLLSVGITALILGGLSIFLSLLLQSRIKNQTIAEVEEQGLAVMQLVAQTVRNADALNSPAPGIGGATLSVNTLVAGTTPTVFDLSGGTVRMTEGTNAPTALTNSRIIVSGLSFQNLSRSATPGTVRITMTIVPVNPEGRNEYAFAKTFTGSATLRQP